MVKRLFSSMPKAERRWMVVCWNDYFWNALAAWEVEQSYIEVCFDNTGTSITFKGGGQYSAREVRIIADAIDKADSALEQYAKDWAL